MVKRTLKSNEKGIVEVPAHTHDVDFVPHMHNVQVNTELFQRTAGYFAVAVVCWIMVAAMLSVFDERVNYRVLAGIEPVPMQWYHVVGIGMLLLLGAGMVCGVAFGFVELGCTGPWLVANGKKM